MTIERISVLGVGQMGTQIALQVAKSGYKVTCYSRKEEKIATLEKAKEFAENWLAKMVSKGKMEQSNADAVMSNLSYTTDIKTASENADLIIECVLDRADIKKAVLSEVDSYAKDDVIYASNSSYIVSSRFCDAVRNPERVMNLHFFNPALVMKVVEVVKGEHTDESAVQQVYEFAKTIDKTPIMVNREIYGFVVNRIFSALTREACYLLDMGIASIEDIDTAVKGGLGHPMGPLELLDMTGIDLEYTVYMEKFAASGDKADLPAACLTERFAKGDFGRKTGKGFYDYDR